MLGQGIGRFGCDFGEEEVLAEEIADEQVLFAFVCEVVSCDLLPWAIGDIAGEHGLCKGRGFVLGADSASADIICYICIDARPLDCFSCLCLHLFHPFVGSMLVSKGVFEEFWGNVDTTSLEEEAGLYGQLIPDAPCSIMIEHKYTYLPNTVLVHNFSLHSDWPRCMLCRGPHSS